MLNYRRSRSYSNSTPTSCAVSMFGLGVVLALGGIVLMVITKNTKHKDEPAIEANERNNKESSDFDDSFRRHKQRGQNINSTLKTLGPFLLGVGITIIVILFLIITAVACGKGLNTPPATFRLPPQNNTSASPYLGEPSNYTQTSNAVNPFPQHSSPSPSSSPNPRSKVSCPQQNNYNMCPTAGLQDPLLESPPSYDQIYIQQRFGENSRYRDDTLIPMKPVSS